jgi:hypothetical protein
LLFFNHVNYLNLTTVDIGEEIVMDSIQPALMKNLSLPNLSRGLNIEDDFLTASLLKPNSSSGVDLSSSHFGIGKSHLEQRTIQPTILEKRLGLIPGRIQHDISHSAVEDSQVDSITGLSRGASLLTHDLRDNSVAAIDGTPSASRNERRGIKRSTTSNNQTLSGTAGNDRLLAKHTNNKLRGNAGNDILQALQGKGRNKLYGGRGNDKLFAKENDTLYGNQGADEFWVAMKQFPKKANIIADFSPGTDIIGMKNLPGVTYFSDLKLEQQGGNTLISTAQGQALAVVRGVSTNALSINNFKGVQPEPPRANLSINNTSVSERDAGVTSAVLNVTLSAASASPVTVDYRTVAGTATPEDNDYAPANGTLTFAPGETVKAIEVIIINDTKKEIDETCTVVLSNPQNAEISAGQAAITIFDNDVETVQANGTQSEIGKDSTITVNYSFSLYNVTPLGGKRSDEDNDLTNNTGRFSGAIENFVGSIDTDTGEQRLFAKFDDLVNFTEPSLDLTAKFFAAGDEILLPDNQLFVVASQDTIEYTLSSKALEDKYGIFELTLIIEDEETLRSIDTVQAVNSIDYIIDRQLLGEVDFLRLSATSFEDPRFLYIDYDNPEEQSIKDVSKEIVIP